jgi:hypothetical protein
MAGALVGVINKFIPVNIAGADYLIAGFITKNNTLQTLGGVALGQSLVGGFLGNGIGSANGGVFEG